MDAEARTDAGQPRKPGQRVSRCISLRQRLGAHLLHRHHAYPSGRNPGRPLSVHPAWQRIAVSVPVYATWDDHDYFNNDKWGLPKGYTETMGTMNPAMKIHGGLLPLVDRSPTG